MMSADDNEFEGFAALWKSGQHLRAGADYLVALQKLGLNPECLFWAEDEVIGHPVLVLVTEQFDRVGPLELSRTLFKAYDHAGTPQELSPFILRLHGPAQTLIKGMEAVSIADAIKEGNQVKDVNGNPANVFIEAGGMKFKIEWVYKWDIPKKGLKIVDLRRRWRRFTENVDRLAA